MKLINYLLVVCVVLMLPVDLMAQTDIKDEVLNLYKKQLFEPATKVANSRYYFYQLLRDKINVEFESLSDDVKATLVEMYYTDQMSKDFCEQTYTYYMLNMNVDELKTFVGNVHSIRGVHDIYDKFKLNLPYEHDGFMTAIRELHDTKKAKVMNIVAPESYKAICNPLVTKSLEEFKADLPRLLEAYHDTLMIKGASDMAAIFKVESYEKFLSDNYEPFLYGFYYKYCPDDNLISDYVKAQKAGGYFKAYDAINEEKPVIRKALMNNFITWCLDKQHIAEATKSATSDSFSRLMGDEAAWKTSGKMSFFGEVVDSMADFPIAISSETTDDSNMGSMMMGRWLNMYISDKETFYKVMDESGADYPNLVAAHFPGGDKAFQSCVRNLGYYPDYSYNIWVDGIVKVKFQVENDGTVTSAEAVSAYSKSLPYAYYLERLTTSESKIRHAAAIRKSVDLLKEECVRFCGRMPKWEPATVFGNPISATVYMNIMFKLR